MKDATIEEERHENASKEESDEHKGKHIAKGVVMLENLFDLKNHLQGPPNTKIETSTLCHMKSNLGTKANPKFINIGSRCSLDEK